MATIAQIEAFLENRIPRTLSVCGDPDGMAVCIDGNAPVTGVVAALDVTMDVIAYAKEKGANLIVTHHPSIYAPLHSITEKDAVGKRMIAAIQAGISLMSYHTRLDAMEGGVNDRLCHLLGVTAEGSFADGLGRVGTLDKEYSYEEFAQMVGKALGTDKLYGINSGKKVRRVALLGGSGKGSFMSALATGADTYVTGEVIHSTLLDAREYGINIICATHYRTESPVISVLCNVIGESFPDIKVYPYYDQQL